MTAPTLEEDLKEIHALLDAMHIARDAWLVARLNKDGTHARQVQVQQTHLNFVAAQQQVISAFITRGDTLRGAEALRQLQEAAVPFRCDGKEQEAFEACATKAGYDMTQHPLHYLFTDRRTDAFRDGWGAALAYVRRALSLPSRPGV